MFAVMLSIKLAACHRPLCRSFVGCRLQREFSTYAEPAAAQYVRLPLSRLSSKSADGTHGHLCDRLSSMSLWSGLTRNETDDKKTGHSSLLHRVSCQLMWNSRALSLHSEENRKASSILQCLYPTALIRDSGMRLRSYCRGRAASVLCYCYLSI